MTFSRSIGTSCRHNICRTRYHRQERSSLGPNASAPAGASGEQIDGYRDSAATSGACILAESRARM